MHEAIMFRSRITKALHIESVITGRKKRRLPVVSSHDDVLRDASDA
jgi:hypothetical protein